MLDHSLESAICAVFKADHQVEGIRFFTALDGETHKLPAVTVISKSESLAGSQEVFRAEVELRIESHAKDTASGEHAATVVRIHELLSAKADILAALNAEGGVQIYGYAISSSSQETGEETFLTTITLKVGYRVPAN